jgi:hypothetical protein
MRVLVFLISSEVLSGCSSFGCCLTLPVSEEQSVHYVILGLGVVSIPKTEQKTAVFAAKSQALGIVVSDQPGAKLGIGYSSTSLVTIPDGAEDVRVEVSQTPGGSVTVNAPSANLK